MPNEATARLKLTVTDDAGRPCPFRAEWGEPLRVERVWSGTGEAEIETAPGRTSLLVRRGIHYDAAALDVDLRACEAVAREVTLRQRFDPRAMGWYGGESHMHVLHGRDDPPRTIADGGPMAAADGLDYLQLCSAWEPTFGWPAPDELDRQCAAASTPHTVVGWNLETPKCYFGEDHGGRKGNLHCFGHGWTVGLRDISRGRAFFRTPPNFRIIQEVHRQGGIVGCAHPMRASFGHGGNFISNWASELPFDFVAGVPYDTLDILNDSPLLFFESERLWYTLLNLGYKVAGTGNSDGALGTTRGLGRYRTYTRIDGAFSWEALAEAMRAGRNVATSGPFVLFEADGEPPGAEFAADGTPRRATIRAWSGPLPGETLTAVQLVRNGEVIRAWDLHAENAREWETTLELADDEFAWYCVRALSLSRDPASVALWGDRLYEAAVANPVYFLPDGFERPRPAPARVSLRVTDETGAPVAATVSVHDGAGEIARHEVPASGEATLATPGTASLIIEAPGCEPAVRNLFMDCPELHDYIRNIGLVWPSFFSPETYRVLRQRLGGLKLSVALKRRG